MYIVSQMNTRADRMCSFLKYFFKKINKVNESKIIPLKNKNISVICIQFHCEIVRLMFLAGNVTLYMGVGRLGP